MQWKPATSFHWASVQPAVHFVLLPSLPKHCRWCWPLCYFVLPVDILLFTSHFHVSWPMCTVCTSCSRFLPAQIISSDMAASDGTVNQAGTLLIRKGVWVEGRAGATHLARLILQDHSRWKISQGNPYSLMFYITLCFVQQVWIKESYKSANHIGRKPTVEICNRQSCIRQRRRILSFKVRDH